MASFTTRQRSSSAVTRPQRAAHVTTAQRPAYVARGTGSPASSAETVDVDGLTWRAVQETWRGDDLTWRGA